MKVDFRRLTWENYPSTETPINADNLNRLEEGVAGLYSDVHDIEQELGAGVGEYVTDWLNEHLDPVGSAVVVDDTLSIEGAAADAKKTGDEISSLKEDLNGATKTYTKTYMSDERYSSNRVYNAEDSNIGKSLSEIYSGATTNAFSYMVDVKRSKTVTFPVGNGNASTVYGNLAFDENDVCVWVFRNTDTSRVAGDLVTVELPENAVKLLLVFVSGLNTLGTEYAVTVVKDGVVSEINNQMSIINKYQIESVPIVSKNLIGESVGVKYSTYIPANTIVTMSTSDGEPLGQTARDILFWREDKETYTRWNFPTNASSRSVSCDHDVYYVSIVASPRCPIQLEIGSEATEYQKYFYNNKYLTESVDILNDEIRNANSNIDALDDKVGNIRRKTFSVNANSTHSSVLDRIGIDIPANTPFDIYLAVSDAVDASLAIIYAIKESDGSDNIILNIYPSKTKNKAKRITLDYAVSAIGIYYSNGASVKVDVNTVVVFGQLELNELYDVSKDNLFVSEFGTTLVKDILERFSTTSDGETFTFYSDPHYLLNNGEMTTSRITNIRNEWLMQLDLVSKAINAQCVICGGDIINAETTDAQLCYKLAMHDSIARKVLGDRYHLALGNHDTRFDATQQSVIDNLLYAQEDTQKAYFSVKTPKTRFYFLNTGTDQVLSMNAYRWGQMQWLVERLIEDKDLNRIIVMHIFSNAVDPSDFGNSIIPMASNVVDIINAYNNKTQITLNGTVYNFSDTVGKIRCILCGHTHYDTVYYASGNIPVLCIDDATAIGATSKLTFDACFVDYENQKLYAYRDKAEMREITLA